MFLINCKLKSNELICSVRNILQTDYNINVIKRCPWRRNAEEKHLYGMTKMTIRGVRLIKVLFIESWLLRYTRVLSKKDTRHMVCQVSWNIH